MFETRNLAGNRKSTVLLAAAATVVLSLLAPATSFAQTGGRIEDPPGLPVVPVAKILAVGI
jgi:hypothetical protein